MNTPDAADLALITQWGRSPHQQRLHPGTRRAARAAVLSLARHRGGLGLPGATAADIAAWLDGPRLPATRDTYLSHTHAFYSWLTSEGIITAAPTTELRAPRRSLADSLAVDVRKLGRRTATLGDLIPAYLTERMRRGEIGAATARNARSVLDGLARSYGGGPARALGGDDLGLWVETLGHLAPATRRAAISDVKGFTAWMVRRRYLASDPGAELGRVRLPRYLPRQLGAGPVAELLRACPDPRARLIVLLQVQEGLRCCEVAGLQLHDISFPDRTVSVRGKGGHERLLPISDETWEALQTYLDGAPCVAGPVIRSYRQRWAGLTADTISGMVSEWMADAKIKRRPRDGISAHALRHTSAGDMLRAGAHLRDVQAALGHASLTSTQRYLPTVVNDLRDAMGGRRYRA